MILYKNKKNQVAAKSENRILISITVMGSAGPIRFVVNEQEMVAAVITTALKSYAREGRLPVLGSDLNDFVLFCPVSGTEALSPCEAIGSFGVRNFMLCKKLQKGKSSTEAEKQTLSRKGNNQRLKTWFNKSVSLKISTH